MDNLKQSKKSRKMERKLKKAMLAKLKQQEVIKAAVFEELRLCELNFQKCHDKWEAIRSQNMSEELKNEIKAYTENFQVYTEVRKEQINLLMNSFDDITHVTSNLFNSHESTINSLFEIYEERVKYFGNIFENELEETLEKDRACREDGENGMRDEEERLRSLISQQQEGKEQQIGAMKDRAKEASLDLEAEHFTNIEKLESDVEDSSEFLLVNIQTQIKSYLYSNKRKIEDLASLKATNDYYKRLILEQNRKIVDFKEDVSRLRMKLREISSNEDLDELKKRKLALLKNYVEKQKEFQEINCEARERLRHLVAGATKSVNVLTKYWEIQEKIIALKGLCYKFEENEERRVLSNDEFLNFDSRSKSSSMFKFYNQLGEVDLSKVLYKKKIEQLQDDITYLKNSLRKVVNYVKGEKP